jgi:hypothetical protein
MRKLTRKQALDANNVGTPVNDVPRHHKIRTTGFEPVTNWPISRR